MSVQVGFWHEDLLRVVKPIEFKVFTDHFCYQDVLLCFETLSSGLVLPVEEALSFVSWVFHLVLVVNNLKYAAPNLCSQLTQDSLRLQGLNHQVFKFVHFKYVFFNLNEI